MNYILIVDKAGLLWKNKYTCTHLAFQVHTKNSDNETYFLISVLDFKKRCIPFYLLW